MEIANYLLKMNALKHTISLSIALTICVLSFAQTRQTPTQYKEKFDQDAVAEMIKSGVPASITLAQGMLESDYGNSALAKKARNHFGIKCHSNWTGGKYYMDDDAKDECFRVYSAVYESYVDHSDFLHRNRRYAFLFDLKKTDYKGWAKGLKKAGYATNPKYPDLLIRLIEENELYKYDKMDKGDMKSLGSSSKGSSGNPDLTPVENPNKQANASAGSSSSNSGSGIQISKNKIKFVKSQAGDTPDILAKRYNMGRWQICHYNGLKKKSKIPTGTIIYLQPKRLRFHGDEKFYTVKKGDNLWKISQMYGVKLGSIRRKNKLEKGAVIKVGQKIKLK
ncbi:MAG: glycoside hydrolase [Crocinitomicaceae bacterium]|nr:glycoside hydrolase [Crocinitomicaceae bacterium]|tara:strand:+ start:235 stop:1242 length:1008 start_codon:yes stop_codon:yes gene_type:complete